MAVNTDLPFEKTFARARKRSDAKEQSALRVKSFTPCPTGRILLATIPGSKLSGYHHQSLPDENADSPTRRNAQTPIRNSWSRRFQTREIQLRFFGNRVWRQWLLFKIETTEHVVRRTIAIS
jgi:hypothetical protein